MRHRIPLSIGLASAALLSCEGANLPAPDDPASITILQGDGLTGRVGEQLDQPLVIQVLDAAGGGVENATVVIELSAGSAEPDTARTDASGQVTSEITLGSQVGETQGTARVIEPESNLPPAGFSFVAFAASANGLAMVSGDGQQGAAGTTLGAPLVVEVTDAFGNPIAGKRITWTVEGGGSVNDPSIDHRRRWPQLGAAHVGPRLRLADDHGELRGARRLAGDLHPHRDGRECFQRAHRFRQRAGGVAGHYASAAAGGRGR